MNPEDNNLNPNPSIPNAGIGNEPMSSAGGLNMADGLASAQDNLTSAGLAASTDAGVMDLGQIGASAPEAVMTPPIDEPLVPAAPVPGSIGSVTSVPPINPDVTGAAPVDTTAPAASGVPVAEPAPAPYNPFATQPSTAPVNPAVETAGNAAPAGTVPQPAMPEMTAPGMTPNPTFQPAVPPKAKGKLSPLMIALCAAVAVLLITNIIFIALFINAKNNPKVVYVPQTPNEESNARIEMLTCSREADFAGYAGVENPVAGSQTMTASYTNNELRALTMDYTMNFADEALATIAQDSFAAEQAEVLEAVGNSFGVDYNINSGNLNIQILSGRDTFDEKDAAVLMYGLGGENSSTTLNAVRSLYESAGYTCSAE